MRRHSKWFLLVLVFTLFAFAGCGGGGEAEVPGDGGEAIPAEVQAVIDNVTSIAANYALQLDGEWADEYNALLASGEGRDYAEYDNLKATLDQFRLESGAYYVYMFTDMDPDDEYFEITVDGSEEPDDWMVQYDVEGQFFVAMDGEPCAALSAWDNGENDPAWSAFAPVYDSDGNIVGILGIDYPAPEIVDFPQWNRDSEEWNGMAVEY
ncbi:hypothetical protein MASR2M70_14300 [Bacillota bacterium]